MAGVGEILVPMTVTTMVRPAGLLGDDGDDGDDADEGDEDGGDEDGGDEPADVDDALLVVAAPGSSADP